MTLSHKQFGKAPTYTQDKMFMSAHEIQSSVTVHPQEYEEDDIDDKSVWKRKSWEADETGLADSIDTQGGVHDPVSIWHAGRKNWVAGFDHESDERPIDIMGQGHHRVATAAQAGKDLHPADERLIPVLHHEDEYGAFHGGYPDQPDQSENYQRQTIDDRPAAPPRRQLRGR